MEKYYYLMFLLIFIFTNIFSLKENSIDSNHMQNNQQDNNIMNNIEETQINNSFDIDTNVFVIIGLTGGGKSLFLNALSNKNVCIISNEGKSQTQENEKIKFIFDNQKFIGIDTPGLDDSLNNLDKINKLKKLISENKTIKKIIIVKKYNDLRLTKSLQDSLIVFMESFPLHNFWDHVLIINTWANPNDENFINFMEENPQKFNDKILNCQYLLDYMKEKDIKLPSEIKEYFIDSYIYIKKNKLKKEFEQIKNDILPNFEYL